ncbi:PREDICTED: protein PAT1 homolog 1, partial [Chaetura pelagica]|uniref:protein PAT1 homolog 1 n=1 Tax=Chaetura pelagica TaxID=8897 RepID=UPI000523780B
EMPSVSVLDYALPQRPLQPRDEERDPSERALPRRSSSPVIGSPPVRAVPIGTPPKQPAVPNFNQQILCPKPVHIRANMQQRYPAPYGDRMSPNQLCNVPHSSLLGHPFPHNVPPVLTHLQRAQLLGGAQNSFQKLEKLSAAEEVQGDGPKKERTKLITPQVAKLEHTYKPVQFEGSLGKLTVSSVNNPRKMIDAVVTSRSEDDETKEKQVRDKRRQTLVTIEKTYSLLLDVEDYERRYLLSLEGERPALMSERKQKICEMYDNLRGNVPGQDRPSDDHLMQIMCIRKGKRLVARILPFLSPEQAADVLMATARNLPFLIKKDAQDEVLPCLLRPFSHVLYHLPLGTVTSLVQQLTNLPQSAATAAPTNLHLSAVLQNKFGLSLLYLILSRGEELQSSEATTELLQDNQWTELMLMATREFLRIPPASLAKPLSTPSNLSSLFSRYVDQQKLNLLETKLQ